ncbi:unnamed protein product, partial [Adineta ricciae]
HKAKTYLDENRPHKAEQVYREELSPFLLENHARDDEQLTRCYMKIASSCSVDNPQQVLKYYQQAIDIYEKQRNSFYTDEAFQLDVNVCRRYAGMLFICYNCLSKAYMSMNGENLAKDIRRKALDIYAKYQDQFQFVINLMTNEIKIEVLPFVELNY